MFCLGPLPSNSREVPGWSRWVKVGLNIASLKYSCGFPGTTRHLQDRAVTYPATSPRRETFFQGLARAAWFSFSLHLPGSVAWLKPLFRKWHSDQGRTQGGTVGSRREENVYISVHFWRPMAVLWGGASVIPILLCGRWLGWLTQADLSVNYPGFTLEIPYPWNLLVLDKLGQLVTWGESEFPPVLQRACS